MLRGLRYPRPDFVLSLPAAADIPDQLIKSERLDVAAKLAQRVETLCGPGAGIAHKIVESVFAGDDNKMGDAASQAHAHDHGVSMGEVRIDELIRGQVFVHVPDAVGRVPCRAVPINPAVVGVSANGSQKPV